MEPNHQEISENTASNDRMQQATNENELQASLDDPKTSELSSQYVGQWSRLVSTTNWEKGRIIVEWREALMGSQSPATSYSDEAWSRRVGGVTPQHVGRLRRVHERFGDLYQTFEGLFWSHFLAALDWDDAEMWLEGAVQSNWSVSQMRRTRWEANGEDPDQRPSDSDIVSVSEDEDFTPLAEVNAASGADGRDTGVQDGTRQINEGPRPDGPDFGDDEYAVPDGSQLAEADDLPWRITPRIRNHRLRGCQACRWI